MKRTLFLFLLCCLLPLGARAEGLWLDGAHAYEGMERSYDMGYSPEEVGNTLRGAARAFGRSRGRADRRTRVRRTRQRALRHGLCRAGQRKRYSFAGEAVDAWCFSFRVPNSAATG